MKNYQAAVCFGDLYSAVSTAVSKPSLFQVECAALQAAFEQDFSSLDDLMETAHQADRIATIFAAGLESETEFKTALGELDAPSWKDYKEPPVTAALQDGLADKLYFQGPLKPEDKAVFAFGEKARYVGRRLIERAMQDKLPFQIFFEGSAAGSNFGRLILNQCPADRRQAVAELFIGKYDGATKSIGCKCDNPTQVLIDYDNEASKKFTELTKPVSDRLMNGSMDYCVTYLPTEKDAVNDEIPYADYVQLFFELCDQPWQQIGQAQEHLIAKLNQGNLVHITSGDGTDLTMELTDHDGTHFTFCNSLVARNVPGSEVFSAPRRDSVNGTVVAKGKFERVAGKTIRDLTLHFNDGRLSSFEAAEGAAHFQEYLDRDPGNYYVGELGKGTNPHLRKHVMNTLLVEKIGPSFHLALGKAYTYKSYMGVPVHVDNGNRSIDHWDITAMLDNGGRIDLDGETIMENGRFVDPALAVLNDGWAAVPVGQRPEHWQDFKGYGTAALPKPRQP